MHCAVVVEDVGACSCSPEGAEFVSKAKLRLAILLYAYAAGGSFLVLARKEPKKPLLGLGICVATIVRVRASEPRQNCRMTGFSPVYQR
ncbi:MAG: hypothetical protein LBO63_02425 [Oscillospiraceae bacterium]|nr:hypothetical protein [Oscillospiraceae bacterium]